MPALLRVMTKYGSGVEVHFWGVRPASICNLSNVFLHPLISDYDKYFRLFSAAGFDIGLAPLKDDVFYRSKTNIKFREYAACHIAGIYSNMDVYSSCVKDKETGLLVSNDPDDWYETMVQLIEEPGLREKIKTNAYDYVREYYPHGDFENVWWVQIKKLLSEKNSSSISSFSVHNVSLGQELRIEKTASFHDQEKESFINPINRKLNTLIHHFQQYGFHLTFWLVRRSLYNYWMVLKLRMLSSSAAKGFRRG